MKKPPTDAQIIALYKRTIEHEGGESLELEMDAAKAIKEIRYVLAAKTLRVATVYLRRLRWGEPGWCALRLREAAKEECR